MTDPKLNPEEKKELLKLARTTISNNLQHGKVEQAETPEGNLAAPCGAFVSLHKHGDLRGCIGTFLSDRPLVHTIQEMAVSASEKDRPRNGATRSVGKKEAVTLSADTRSVLPGSPTVVPK